MEHGIEAIGHVVGGRTDRGDDGWDREVSTIELTERFGPDALAGLDTFSHVEVVFRFHLLADDDVTTDARHPRNNPSGRRSASSPSAAASDRTVWACRSVHSWASTDAR